MILAAYLKYKSLFAAAAHIYINWMSWCLIRLHVNVIVFGQSRVIYRICIKSPFEHVCAAIHWAQASTFRPLYSSKSIGYFVWVSSKGSFIQCLRCSYKHINATGTIRNLTCVKSSFSHACAAINFGPCVGPNAVCLSSLRHIVDYFICLC